MAEICSSTSRCETAYDELFTYICLKMAYGCLCIVAFRTTVQACGTQVTVLHRRLEKLVFSQQKRQCSLCRDGDYLSINRIQFHEL